MKSFIKKLLLGDEEISEYPTIRIPTQIQEKVHLQNHKMRIDITHSHWLLCLNPFIWGIWVSGDAYNSIDCKAGFYMYFFDSEERSTSKKNATAIVSLSFFDCMDDAAGVLILLKVDRSCIYYLDFLRRYFLFSRYYKKNELTFFKFKALVAAYSYPRRIRLISFRQADYYNLFPMDLLGDIGLCKRYVFGLRHTNVSLPRIIKAGKLVVSEVSYEHKQALYKLGKHHSSQPPALNTLDFALTRSKNFKFYLPEWVTSYKEIKVLTTKNLGSQMLLWGEVLHEEISATTNDSLFVIHFLKYLHQKKNGNRYPLV